MDAATAKLSEATSSLAQKMYAEQAGEAGSGEGAQQAESADDDGAVEAEFEEVKDDNK
jgi:molecular chaperone DnaK